MPVLLKDPSAILDYAIDWGKEYLADDVISASDWSVSSDELKVVASSFDERLSQVQLSEGIAGRVYRVSNQVVTTAGRQDSRSLTIRVELR